MLRAKQSVTARVRLRGGATRTLNVRLRRPGFLEYQTDPALVAELDRLLDRYKEDEIVPILNSRGFRSGAGLPLSARIIRKVRAAYGLRSRSARLHAAGMVRQRQFAAQFGVTPSTIVKWTRQGRVHEICGEGRGHLTLYEPADPKEVERYRRTTNRSNGRKVKPENRS